MEKKKLLTVLVFCLIAGMAMADHVIGIDINGDSSAAYSGEAAVAGATEWNAYYVGTGIAMGSAGTSGLPDYNEPNQEAIFASQVWLTDDSVSDHSYVPGSALMDDGFTATGATDPCITLFAQAMSADLSMAMGSSFGGTFDIYVYGSGNFTIGGTQKNASGGFTGTYVEGQNYVVFQDVVIDDGNGVVIGDDNDVTIVYDGVLNGIQLVREKPILQLTAGTGNYIDINTADYDLAYESNTRSGENNHFGPDIWADVNQAEYYGEQIGYIDSGEYMEYDVNVGPSDVGRYSVYVWLDTHAYTPGESLRAIVNGIDFGTLTADTSEEPIESSVVHNMNFFQGINKLRWRSTGVVGSNIYNGTTSIAGPLGYMRLAYEGPIDMNCALVEAYGYGYTGDYNHDCIVDGGDLAEIVDHWVECYSPDDVNECF